MKVIEAIILQKYTPAQRIIFCESLESCAGITGEICEPANPKSMPILTKNSALSTLLKNSSYTDDVKKVNDRLESFLGKSMTKNCKDDIKTLIKCHLTTLAQTMTFDVLKSHLIELSNDFNLGLTSTVISNLVRLSGAKSVI